MGVAWGKNQQPTHNDIILILDNQEGFIFYFYFVIIRKMKKFLLSREQGDCVFTFVVFPSEGTGYPHISVCNENMVYFMFRITVNGRLLQRRAMTFVFENKGSGALVQIKEQTSIQNAQGVQSTNIVLYQWT